MWLPAESGTGYVHRRPPETRERYRRDPRTHRAAAGQHGVCVIVVAFCVGVITGIAFVLVLAAWMETEL